MTVRELFLGSGIVLGCAIAALADPTVALNSDSVCYKTTGPDNTVTVEMGLSGASAAIVGGQFFLQYDTSTLDFVSIGPGDAPFVKEIFVSVDEASGTIDYAVGINEGTNGATSGTMVVVTFTALTEVCDTAGVVAYRVHSPPTRLIDENDSAFSERLGNLQLTDMSAITVDDTGPVLSVPANVTVECDQSTDTSNTGQATATDNCDGTPSVTSSDSTAAGACAQESIITRTWTATDACGNSTSLDQIITVVDTTAPILSLPANVTIECDESTDTSNAGQATATDNCDGSPSVSFSDSTASGACAQESVITRTWTATDACGNSTSLDQVITVVDTTAPVLSLPSNVTVECDESSDTSNTGEATATDNCDGSPSVSFTDSTTGGACAQESTITRTWTATDGCGNSTSLDQVITVVDTTAPVLSLPADVTIECDESSDTSNTGEATATDNCDGSPSVTFSDSTAAGACAQESVITRTWSATDACGNSTSLDQVIAVVDTTAPVFDTFPADLTVECTSSTDPNSTGEPTGSDNCGGEDLTSTLDLTIIAGSDDAWQELPSGTMAVTGGGLLYRNDDGVTRHPGMRWVSGSLPPQGSIINVCHVTMRNSQGITTGITGANLHFQNAASPPAFSLSGFNITNRPKTSGVSWDLFPWGGNSDAQTPSLVAPLQEIVDNFSPTALVLLIVPNGAGNGSEGQISAFEANPGTSGRLHIEFTVPAPTPAISFVDSSVSGCGDTETITRTWTVTDDCGNSTSQDQIITVVDNTAPSATFPPDVTVECTDSTDPSATGEATGSDTCGAVTIVSSDASVVDCGNTETITRTWTITDDCGNSVSQDQIITVVDTTAPVLSLPSNVTIECDESSDTSNTGEATAKDNCDGSPSVTFSDSTAAGACAQESVITRTWSATDACGNSTSLDQVITVVDTTAPVVSLPSNVTIECDESTDSANTGQATATDNCDGSPSVTFSDNTAPGACAQESVITRTWTATDACGNATSLDQVITVIDTTAPVLTLPADVTIECDDSTDPSNTGQATATDNCDGSPLVTFSDSAIDGEITRTWTATDDCGNSTSLDQMVIVVDTTPPVLSLPADVTIECDVSADPSNTGEAAAVDNCDESPTVSFTDSTSGGGCSQDSFITRTWTATDFAGNSTSLDQIITVVDTTAPILSLPANVTVECDESADTSNTGEATATDNCDGSPSVSFNDSTAAGACAQESVITRTWTATDACGNSTSLDQVITVVDTTPPVLTLPSDIDVNADAGFCSSSGDFGAASAIDNCDADVEITNDAPFEFPTGETIVTWTATDDCGNVTEGTQTVTVSAFNELIADLELSPAVDPSLSRCITLELFECGGSSVVVEQEVTFTNGLATGVSILVPCGNYGCITARDVLHTLRRTDADDFAIVGTQYATDFTDQSGFVGDDDSLVGGNLNDDDFIDILDFGVYVNRFGTDYGTGDTTCPPTDTHADISGNGLVLTEDFTFIQINFLAESDPNCCGEPSSLTGAGLASAGPVTEISVEELRRLGLAELIVADLNNDGWLDEADMAAFLMGARP